MTRQQLAELCHETNRRYCLGLGDASQAPWAEAPDWQRQSALNGVTHHLTTIRAGRLPQPAESHESWLKEKLDTGWRYGLVKNPETKEHPCCVPFHELPLQQRVKDVLFVTLCVQFSPLVAD